MKDLLCIWIILQLLVIWLVIWGNVYDMDRCMYKEPESSNRTQFIITSMMFPLIYFVNLDWFPDTEKCKQFAL